MAVRVCPWWLGYFLLGPLRAVVQDPRVIVRPYVSPGMTVLEAGPGMGFFTLELARLVGPRGRVVAVDVQPRMLDVLRRRASRARLLDRVEARQAPASGLGVGDLAGQVGFALLFAVAHEVPALPAFLAEVARTLAPGGRVLLAEPRGHVSERAFQQTLDLAAAAGLTSLERRRIAFSRAAVLRGA